MAELLDDEGGVHEQGLLSGGWNQQQGLFGPKRDTNWLGQPNVKRDFLGQAVPARGFFGDPLVSSEGRPLYRAAASGGEGSAEGLIAVGGILLILAAFLTVGVFVLMFKIIRGMFHGWAAMVRRYPRTMLVVHLLLGMAAVYGGLTAAMFAPPVPFAGAALVPVLWAWLALTRRLPLIFMPINAALLGGAFWWASTATAATWQPVWAGLTVGLPGLGNLPVVLAVLPMALWLWLQGLRLWPRVFAPINQVAFGAVLELLLLRAWPAWMRPVPLQPPVGALVFLLPLTLWLWLHGQARWPQAFVPANLLLFGGLLALTGVHTRSTWNMTWAHWAGGLPLVGAPIATIGLGPVSLWGWTRANRWRPEFFAIPNMLLTGGILWLALDRTRPLWSPGWRRLWDGVPVVLDPALLLLVLPLGILGWKWGSRRRPERWGAARALLWGAIAWWLLERSQAAWRPEWQSFARRRALDPALLVAVLPLLVWGWRQVRSRFPLVCDAAVVLAIALTVGWTTGQALPASTAVVRLGLVLLLPAIWAWTWFLHAHPRLGWGAVALSAGALGLLVVVSPVHTHTMWLALRTWLAGQGISVA